MPVSEIADNDYDLSINRYKEIVYEEVNYPLPFEILDDIATLEAEIQQDIENLRALLR